MTEDVAEVTADMTEDVTADVTADVTEDVTERDKTKVGKRRVFSMDRPTSFTQKCEKFCKRVRGKNVIRRGVKDGLPELQCICDIEMSHIWKFLVTKSNY